MFHSDTVYFDDRFLFSLEDKVLALYFCEDGFSPDFLTRKLKMCYGELKKKNQNFEVVLLYLYDTHQTMHSTKEKFQKTFETMPWLALPYKDPVHKKLKRLFGYPDERFHYIDGPRLVIVGTGEFEVIYFPNNKDEDGKRVADMPWLISYAVKLLPGSAYLSFYGNSSNRYHSSLLLAFGRDGSLLRRSICPYFGDDHFPFYAEGLDDVNNVKTDAFDVNRSDFCWGYWDTLYQGLLRDSRYHINFPSADHLFGVYYY